MLAKFVSIIMLAEEIHEFTASALLASGIAITICLFTKIMRTFVLGKNSKFSQRPRALFYKAQKYLLRF